MAWPIGTRVKILPARGIATRWWNVEAIITGHGSPSGRPQQLEACKGSSSWYYLRAKIRLPASTLGDKVLQRIDDPSYDGRHVTTWDKCLWQPEKRRTT